MLLTWARLQLWVLWKENCSSSLSHFTVVAMYCCGDGNNDRTWSRRKVNCFKGSRPDQCVGKNQDAEPIWVPLILSCLSNSFHKFNQNDLLFIWHLTPWGLTNQWGRGPICPPQNIVPQMRAVSVDMDGPILYRIICSLMPISQLFCWFYEAIFSAFGIGSH
jgi:hypothetical protein